jgi:hypothetical protein
MHFFWLDPRVLERRRSARHHATVASTPHGVVDTVLATPAMHETASVRASALASLAAVASPRRALGGGGRRQAQRSLNQIPERDAGGDRPQHTPESR